MVFVACLRIPVCVGRFGMEILGVQEVISREIEPRRLLKTTLNFYSH